MVHQLVVLLGIGNLRSEVASSTPHVRMECNSLRAGRAHLFDYRWGIASFVALRIWVSQSAATLPFELENDFF
jgi:hypothetical protein